MADRNIFIFAGETSGDLYSAMLLMELKQKLPDVHFWGVGGPSSKDLIERVLPMEKFQVMGLSDVLKALPRLVTSFYTLKKQILSKNPEMCIFIDQPSFSIKLAKKLREAGYKGKIVQYVAPTVWAWKKERADEMAKYFDLLLTLFDFEPKYFAHTKLKTVFVGHPIVELIANDNSQSLVFDSERPVLALFPGSRPAEIRRNLPKQLEAAILYRKKHPTVQIAVSGSQLPEDLAPQGVALVPFNARYELMKKCHLAIAKSGTVTLELALHEVPTVVTYELSRLNYLMARFVMKVDKMPYFSIVNILAGKEVFIERIKGTFTAKDIAESLENIRYKECVEECQKLKEHVVGSIMPTKIASQEICKLLNSQ